MAKGDWYAVKNIVRRLSPIDAYSTPLSTVAVTAIQYVTRKYCKTISRSQFRVQRSAVLEKCLSLAIKLQTSTPDLARADLKVACLI